MATAFPHDLPSIETGAGTALEVPHEYFLQHILPPLRSNVDPYKVLAKLTRTRSRARRLVTKQGRWRGFAVDPVDAKRYDYASLSRFTDIVNAISDAGASEGAQPTVHLIARHSADPTEDSDRQRLPSAYMAHCGASCYNASWEEMNVLAWFSPKDQEEDREEVSVARVEEVEEC